MRERSITGVILLIAILVALLTRLGAVIVPLKDFDSDEAVIGLMARDILAGESWPVFYAGQSYLGALEPWSVAASFGLLGDSAFSLRLVPLLYSLAFLIAAYFLLRRFFSTGATGLILLWTALGTPFFNLWTVKARGIVEVLLLGTLFLLVFERIWPLRTPGAGRLAVLGAVAGFGLFANPLVGSLMAVPLAMLAARALAECRPLLAAQGWTIKELACFRALKGRVRVVFLLLAGVGLVALLVATPLLLVGDRTLERWVGISLLDGTDLARYVFFYFALLYIAELATLARRLPGGFGRFVQQFSRGSAGLQMLLAIGVGHLAFSIAATSAVAVLGGGGHDQPFRLAPLVSWPDKVLLLFGEIVPTASGQLAGLAGPLMAAVCIWLGALLFQRRHELRLENDGEPRPISPLMLFGGTTMATMLLVATSAYTQDAASARYLLPLLVSLPATLHLLLEWGTAAFGAGRTLHNVLLCLLTIGLAAGAVRGQASMLSPRSSASPYPGLVHELESRGGTTFIADYWTAYPVAFLGMGRIAVAPADGADRFPVVSAQIRAQGPDAYVFVDGSASLDEFLASPQAAGTRREPVTPGGGGSRYHLFYVER